MAGCGTRTSFAGHPGVATKTDDALTSNRITTWGQASEPGPRHKIGDTPVTNVAFLMRISYDSI